jgi:hypothetical protein
MAVSSNTASVSLAVHSRRSFGLSPLIRADAGLHVALLPRRAAPQVRTGGCAVYAFFCAISMVGIEAPSIRLKALRLPLKG